MSTTSEGVNIQQAADEIGVSAKTLREWESQGRLPFTVARTDGGHRRYEPANVAALRELLAQGEGKLPMADVAPADTTLVAVEPGAWPAEVLTERDRLWQDYERACDMQMQRADQRLQLRRRRVATIATLGTWATALATACLALSYTFDGWTDRGQLLAQAAAAAAALCLLARTRLRYLRSMRYLGRSIMRMDMGARVSCGMLGMGGGPSQEQIDARAARWPDAVEQYRQGLAFDRVRLGWIRVFRLASWALAGGCAWAVYEGASWALVAVLAAMAFCTWFIAWVGRATLSIRVPPTP